MFRAFAYLLTAVLAFAPPALGQPAPGVDQKKLASATLEWLKADVEKGRIPGAVVLVARDGKILLHEAVALDEIDIRADADLARFGWKKGLFGLDIVDGRFKLAVDKKGMTLAGDGRLGEEAASLKWSEAFGKDAAPRRTLDLKTRFKVDTLAAAGFDVRQYLSGTYGAELKITGTDDGRTQVDGVYDLQDAAFTTPGVPEAIV